jgi:tetratricopeptide (TPR) repeat protein
MKSRWVLFLVGAVVLAVFLAFGRSLFQGFAPLDDQFLIVGNLAVRGFTYESLRLAFTTYDPELYIPLTILSFQANFAVAGLQPFTWHLVNLLFHAGNALLVAWIVSLFTGRKGIALFCGLLFAVHPLNAEAVVWVAGRKDLLSTFFFLLTFLTYLSYRGGRKWMLAVSIICFILALLAKVMTVTLPVALLLSDFILERRKFDWKLVLEKIPYVLLSGLFIVVALYGKERVLSSSTLLETGLMGAKSTAFYLLKFLLPFNLSVFYPYHGAITFFDPQFLVPTLLLAALAVCAIVYARRAPLASFGFLFFLLTVAPTFPQFHKGASMFFAVDRYAYLPSIGILVLLAGALAAAAHSFGRASTEARWGTAGGVLLLFILLSVQQTGVWDSTQTLFGHALALYPSSIEARIALADDLRARGKVQDAFELLKEGLQYDKNDSRLYVNAGYLYAETGNVEEARKQFEKAKSLAPADPDPVYALASLDAQTGYPAEAEAEYAAVIALDPSFVGARVHLSEYLIAAKNLTGADAQLREALRWNPSSVPALVAMAELLEIRKEPGAEVLLARALALDPVNKKALALREKIGKQ